jgi:pimeloyl-ACP methyl ester carboxylesterase
VPAHIFYRAEDVLAPHLSRLGTLPANVVAARIEGGAAVLAASNDDHFAAHAAAVSVVDAAKQVASATSAMSATRRVFMTSSGMMSCLMRPGEAGTVMLVLPDVGAPAQIPASLPSAQRVLVSELPGHGASRPWPAAQCTVHNAAQAITDVIRQLGITRFAVQAHGVSCAIAALLCHEPGCEAVELHNPLVLEAAEREQFLSLLPDATPHATGAHLVAAWNWVRMKYLFWPWLPQDGKAARMVDAPAPRRVHEETLQVLRCGAGLQPLCASALAVDMAKELGHSNAHVRLFCDAEPEPRRLAQRLADHLQLHKQDSASGDGAWSRQ